MTSRTRWFLAGTGLLVLGVLLCAGPGTTPETPAVTVHAPAPPTPTPDDGADRFVAGRTDAYELTWDTEATRALPLGEDASLTVASHLQGVLHVTTWSVCETLVQAATLARVDALRVVAGGRLLTLSGAEEIAAAEDGRDVLSAADVADEVAGYTGDRDAADRLMWVGTARIALEPDLAKRVAATVADPSTARPARELGLDLLAHAGVPEAQAALRDALSADAVATDPAFPAYLSRLAFVEAPEPEPETVTWLHARIGDADPRIRRAALATTGAVAHRIAATGDGSAERGRRPGPHRAARRPVAPVPAPAAPRRPHGDPRRSPRRPPRRVQPPGHADRAGRRPRRPGRTRDPGEARRPPARRSGHPRPDPRPARPALSERSAHCRGGHMASG